MIQRSKFSQFILGIFLAWAILFIFYHCRLDSSDHHHLMSLPRVKFIQNDLVQKYGCLADVPAYQIQFIESCGYKIIELDYEINNVQKKSIIIYEEL